jgi:fructan beta-fructosidase
MISSGHRQAGYLAMQYFVGDFDGKSFKPQKQNEVFYVDEGKDFYAAIPFYNLPKTQKNPIIIGWTNDWEYANEIPAPDGYRGGFSVARKLSLHKAGSTYKLQQQPIISEKLTKEELSLSPGYTLNSKLGEKTANSYVLNLDINLSTSKGFDLELLKTTEHHLTLSYDVASNMLSLDRINSGKTDFHKRFPSVESVKVMPEKNKLRLEILVDKTVVEVYVNEGKVVLTDLVFPESLKTGEVLKWR